MLGGPGGAAGCEGATSIRLYLQLLSEVGAVQCGDGGWGCGCGAAQQRVRLCMLLCLLLMRSSRVCETAAVCSWHGGGISCAAAVLGGEQRAKQLSNPVGMLCTCFPVARAPSDGK
jgi:hypothetical protein